MKRIIKAVKAMPNLEFVSLVLVAAGVFICVFCLAVMAITKL